MRAAAILAMAAAAGAAAEPPYVNHGIPAQDPRRFRAFHNPERPIIRYLAEAWNRPRPGSTQHFCIVAFDGGRMKGSRAHDLTAYVHWAEGRHLIMWEPPFEAYHDDALRMTRRDWDFRTDVQRHPDPMRMTDWITDWGFVNEMLRACRRVGWRVTIAVPPAGSRAGRTGLWTPIPLPKEP